TRSSRQIVPRQWPLDATTVSLDSYPRNTVVQSWDYGHQIVILPGERRMLLLVVISGQGLFVDPKSKLIMQTAVRKLPIADLNRRRLWRCGMRSWRNTGIVSSAGSLPASGHSLPLACSQAERWVE